MALYKAIFASAYYGLLRISEIAKGHPVLARDVHIGMNKNRMMFILRTSKTHWLDVEPKIVKISSHKHNTFKHDTDNVDAFCPFGILRNYIKFRTTYIEDNEPFFVFTDRSPLNPGLINNTLKSILKDCKINPKNFSMHGFHAG